MNIFEGYSDQVVRKFLDFHKRKPEVYQAFKDVILKVRSRGRERWGAKAAMEIVRYKLNIEKDGEYKIQNSFTALYARVLLYKHPELEGFIVTKQAKGIKSLED